MVSPWLVTPYPTQPLCQRARQRAWRDKTAEKAAPSICPFPLIGMSGDLSAGQKGQKSATFAARCAILSQAPSLGDQSRGA